MVNSLITLVVSFIINPIILPTHKDTNNSKNNKEELPNKILQASCWSRNMVFSTYPQWWCVQMENMKLIMMITTGDDNDNERYNYIRMHQIGQQIILISAQE